MAIFQLPNGGVACRWVWKSLRTFSLMNMILDKKLNIVVI